MIRSAAAIVLLLCFFRSFAQDTLRKPPKKKPDYRKKEEIIYDNKRYRLYNNYLTVGGGIAQSSIRSTIQKVAGADFNFHIRREYFQMGLLVSGENFFNNNHLQVHACYGVRKEGNTYNLAFFAGPTYYQGVEGQVPQPPVYYDGAGLYLSFQATQKLTYDLGGGLEFFCDFGFESIGREQVMYGARFILFFSGSYRGLKRNYNPNVRAENPNG